MGALSYPVEQQRIVSRGQMMQNDDVLDSLTDLKGQLPDLHLIVASGGGAQRRRSSALASDATVPTRSASNASSAQLIAVQTTPIDEPSGETRGIADSKKN